MTSPENPNDFYAIQPPFKSESYASYSRDEVWFGLGNCRGMGGFNEWTYQPTLANLSAGPPPTMRELMLDMSDRFSEVYTMMEIQRKLHELELPDGQKVLTINMPYGDGIAIADPLIARQISPQFNQLISLSDKEMVYTLHGTLYVLRPTRPDKVPKVQRDDIPNLFCHNKLMFRPTSYDEAAALIMKDPSLGSIINLAHIEAPDDPLGFDANPVERKDLFGLEIFDKFFKKAVDYAISTGNKALAGPDERVILPVIELKNSKPMRAAINSHADGSETMTLETVKTNEYMSDGGFTLIKDINGAVKLLRYDATDNASGMEETDWDATKPRYAELMTLVGSKLDQYFKKLEEMPIEKRKFAARYEDESVHEYRVRMAKRGKGVLSAVMRYFGFIS